MTKTAGQIAYEAYRETCCGPQAVTWRDYALENSEEIPGWEAAAGAVIEMCASSIRETLLLQGVVVDDFDRGWAAGTIDAENAIRALKDAPHG